MTCKICSGASIHFGDALVLGKHPVRYFRCTVCGFVQTEPPFWLDEAYASAITSTDIGSVNRALTFGRLTRRFILAFFSPGARFLDYGGGYGLFTRLMRDWGFDFHHYDRYCQNLFAQGFDADLNAGVRYELMTAFEVFEHLNDPLSEIEQMLRFSRTIVFSTQLVPASNPKPGEWWYYSPEHGQHIAFYTRAALDSIARRFGLRVYTNGSSLHLLTEKRINDRLFQFMFRHRITRLLDLLLSRRMHTRSLLAADYAKLSGVRLPGG
ncbi:MAG: hypothetical protein OHK0022_14270 [Roseiflexaceae bacterium]